MSGIAGIYYLDGRPVEEEIGRMVKAMEYRGPDEQNTWTDDSVGLGHCMLETTPEDQYESLPLDDQTGNFVITADARLDNRSELTKKLDIQERKDRAVTDTELILAAYKRWGRDCPKKLLGPFAFSVWDKNEKYLFCSRDHIGVKPLYYYFSPKEVFVFASEINPIISLEDLPCVLNDMRIADMFGYLQQDKENTFFDGMRRLPPAHTKCISESDITTKKYWSLDPTREVNLGSEEAYVERFRELFLDAVSSRMRSPTPIGSMLSGGLDSSSVACAASRLKKDGEPPVHTFSAVHPDVPETDESNFIDYVLQKYNFKSHIFRGDKFNPISPLLETKNKPLDEPQQGFNLHIPWISHKIAKDNGIRVILSGENGDGTINHGYRIFREYAEKGNWMKLMQELLSYAQNMGEDPLAIARPYIKHFILGPILNRVPAYQLIRDVLRSAAPGTASKDEVSVNREDLLRPGFAEQLNWEDRRDALLEEWKRDVKTLRDLHHRTQTSGIKQRGLEEYDRMTARFGVEVRMPFWDRNLVEFCLALPPELKLSDGWNRRIHRLGTEGILPEQVQWRRDKSDMSPAFQHNFIGRNRAKLKKVTDSPSYIDNYANMDVLRTCFERAVEGSCQSSGVELLHLKTALSLEVWLEQMDSISAPKA